MPGTNDQINKYKSAVGSRNEGSQPSRQQMQKAQNTSIGKTRGSMVSSGRTSSPSSPRMAATSVSGKPRGSWEGYQHANSTVLNMNGRGYDNKSLQKARNNPKTTNVQSQKSGSIAFNSKLNSSRDSRNVGLSKNNSICKIKKLTKSRL